MSKPHPIVTALFAEVKRQGISDESLEYLSGVYRKTQWDWKTGKLNPRMDKLVAALDAIGYELAIIPKNRPHT